MALNLAALTLAKANSPAPRISGHGVARVKAGRQVLRSGVAQEFFSALAGQLFAMGAEKVG